MRQPTVLSLIVRNTGVQVSAGRHALQKACPVSAGAGILASQAGGYNGSTPGNPRLRSTRWQHNVQAAG
jgi:hypothetical protein